MSTATWEDAVMGDAAADKLAFGPFQLDRAQARLVRRDSGQTVALTPKAFELLQFLAYHPNRLLTKDELLSTLWPDVIVGDASIKVAVREIRKALEDDSDAPTYIETVHRRGYRFIASVSTSVAADSVTSSNRASPPLAVSPATSRAPAHEVVGRDPELRRLVQMLSRAASGKRQCALVTGSPGSGKSALVEQFLRQIAAGGIAEVEPPAVLVGHCFEQFGAGEPYLPVWEAIGRAARERPGSALASLVARHATAGALIGAPVAAGAENGNGGVGTRHGLAQRLLGDLAGAIEELATASPVVFVLEDAHWVDHSTLDLLSALSRRRGAAQLMLVVTLRPADVSADEHPLGEVVRELLAARLAEELPLGLLDAPAVERYLALRFDPDGAIPSDFAKRLHERTDGHPLFLAHLLDDLVDHGVLIEQDRRLRFREPNDATWTELLDTRVPQTVRALIESQLESLSADEQRVLEAASVAGTDCSAAAVAAALGDDVIAVEEHCAELARRHRFLAPAGVSEWPDGTVASAFGFVHDLYHGVVYERLGVARRAQLHRALGVRLEQAWGARAAEEAAQLARHFEIGRDWPRAATYLRHAADAAARQYAHREAVGYLRRALAAVARLAEADRREHELPLLMSLGVNLQVTLGCGAAEVERVYGRMEALIKAGDRTAASDPETYPILWGIWVFHKVRSDLRRADELARRLLATAEARGDAALLLQAHQAMCGTSLCLGDPKTTVEHMRHAAAIYDPAHHASNTQRYGQDPGVATLAFGSVALCQLGDVEGAQTASAQALDFARRGGQPSTVALATHFAAMLHQLIGDAAGTAKHARAGIELATEEGFSFWLAGGRVLHGWATAASGKAAGIAAIRAGLAAWDATGSKTYKPYFLGLLGDALLRFDRRAEALEAIEQGIALARGLPEGLYEQELLKLKRRL